MIARLLSPIPAALVALLLALAAGGLLFWMHSRQFETTDDAQVDGHMNPIAARIDGNVVRVYVENNQSVKTGDPLIDLDPRDYQVSLDQYVAKLAQARSMVLAQEPVTDTVSIKKEPIMYIKRIICRKILAI